MTAPTDYYVDASLGTNTGDGTVGTPWGRATGSVVQYALDTITRDATNGDRINVKSGATDTLAAALNTTTYGSPGGTAPLIIQGYNTTQGDNPATQPIIDGAATYAIISETATSSMHFFDVHLQNCGSVTNMIRLDNFIRIINCELDDFTGSTAVQTDLYGQVIGCYFHNIAARGCYANIGLYHRNRFIDGTNKFTTAAITVDTSQSAITENIISVSGACDGIQYDLNAFVRGNSVYSNAGTGTGIAPRAAGKYGASIMNNLIEGFSGAGGVGIEINAPTYYYDGNSVYDCTTDFSVTTGNDLYGGVDNESLSASPFTDAANGDFTPVDTGSVKESTYPSKIGVS